MACVYLVAILSIFKIELSINSLICSWRKFPIHHKLFQWGKYQPYGSIVCGKRTSFTLFFMSLQMSWMSWVYQVGVYTDTIICKIIASLLYSCLYVFAMQNFSTTKEHHSFIVKTEWRVTGSRTMTIIILLFWLKQHETYISVGSV